MMNYAMNNNGYFEGRLTQEPRFFTSGSGGETVVLKVACKRNYISQQKEEPDSDFVEFRTFLPKGAGRQIYQYLHTGDLVAICYTIRSGSYESADGTKNYYEHHVILQLNVKESKQVREERFQSRQAGQENPSTKKRKVG